MQNRSVYLDAAVIGGLLALGNGLFGLGDIGFLGENPTPYLLLPLLLGGRYGTAAGVGGAMLALAMIVGGRYLTEGSDPWQVIHAHRYPLLGLFAMGAIAGELEARFHRKLLASDAEKESLRVRLRKLDDELYCLRESKEELERNLATRDNEIVSLDTRVRRLHEFDGRELFENILELLRAQARVTEAAYYEMPEGAAHLELKGEIGGNGSMPQEIERGSIDLVDLAVERRTIVHLKEPWEDDKSDSVYMMAVPLLDGEEGVMGVVLVRRIPMINLTRRTVRLVHTICKWAADVVAVKRQSSLYKPVANGGQAKRVYREEYLLQALETSVDSYRSHRIPSSVVLFSLPGRERHDQEWLEQTILPVIRSGDVPAEVSGEFPRMAVLLPLTGERGAEIFLKRCLDQCTGHDLINTDLEHRVMVLNGEKGLREVLDEFFEETISHAA